MPKISSEKNKGQRGVADATRVEDFYDQNGEPADFQKPLTHSRALVIGLASGVIFGFLAGLVGVIFFFSGALAGLKIGPEYLFPAQQLKIERNEQVNVLEDERLEQVSQEAKTSIVSLFKKKSISNKLLDNIYLPTDRLAMGFVLTNDGWILTQKDALTNPEGTYVVTTFDKQILTVEKIIFDDYNNVAFLKTNGRNLNTLGLSPASNLTAGDKLLLFQSFDGAADLRVVRVMQTNFKDAANTKALLKATSQVSSFLLLDQVLGKNFWGGPVINLAGEAVGILLNKDGLEKVVVYEDLKRGLEEILAGQDKIERVSLGVKYLDLSQLVGGSIKIKKGNEVRPLENGALVAELVAGSPAAKAKIQVNDVIIKVGTEDVNTWNNLSRLIQNYKKGESVNLTILREGSEEEKVVTVNF
jgi:S1-C subfamily serine protease